MSSPEDRAFSPTNGILLADISRGVPIVSLKEKRTILRGYPYSTCHESGNKSGLDFFDSYTKNQCRQECMTKVIQQKCQCWPNSIGIVQRKTLGNRLKILLSNTFKGQMLQNCDFLQHSACVAPIVSNFEPTKHWYIDCKVKLFRIFLVNVHRNVFKMKRWQTR